MTTALTTIYNDFNALVSNVNSLCFLSEYLSKFQAAGYTEAVIESLGIIGRTLESMLWNLDKVKFRDVVKRLQV